MSGFDESDREPDWVWNTRVTAEAARAALLSSQIPQERFQLFEKLTVAACQGRKYTNRRNEAATNEVCGSDGTLYGNVEIIIYPVSKGRKPLIMHRTMQEARLLKKCFRLLTRL